MFAELWHTYLFQPLLNVLIMIYNSSVGNGNLGWSVVWLTIFLRLVLLPLSLLDERSTMRREQAAAEARAIADGFKNDKIALSQETRKIMRKYKISPWAKVLVLGVQVLVLFLLYQVFISGITGERLSKNLYPSVDLPGNINTDFYGFDIGKRNNSLWAGIAAVYFFVDIFREYRRRKPGQKPDLLYFLGFPVLMFVVLWYLPMVKSLFVLTTMLFSDILSIFGRIIFRPKKASAPAAAHH